MVHVTAFYTTHVNRDRVCEPKSEPQMTFLGINRASTQCNAIDMYKQRCKYLEIQAVISPSSLRSLRPACMKQKYTPASCHFKFLGNCRLLFKKFAGKFVHTYKKRQKLVVFINTSNCPKRVSLVWSLRSAVNCVIGIKLWLCCNITPQQLSNHTYNLWTESYYRRALYQQSQVGVETDNPKRLYTSK